VLAWVFLQDGIAPGRESALISSGAWRARFLDSAKVSTLSAPRQSQEWTAYRGGLSSQAYSPVQQINRSNVANLKIAWRWSGGNFGPAPELRNITTPLMIDGVLYFTAGITRDVVAVNARTGETLWMWRPQESSKRFDQAARKGAGRGVAFWRNSKGANRVFTITPGFQLVALDARTGVPVPGFGKSGAIDLRRGLRKPKHLPLDIGSSSPPLVVGDVVVAGSAQSPIVRSRANVKGDIRAYSARTGALLWTFKTIPDVNSADPQDWSKGSSAYTGNAGSWAPMSADPKLGTVYMAIQPPTNDFFGGERPGANRYANSLVCLDAKTGRLRWSFQITHHDIWDYDVSAAPILIDIPKKKEAIEAVAEVTKQGFLFVFNRATGHPVWPIVERPVPPSEIPGEAAWPTQPFPTKPAPYEKQAITFDDLIDLTPQLKARALQVVKSYKLGALYTPPSLEGSPDGLKGSIVLPSSLGGGNWEGGAVDPETGIVYVGSMTVAEAVTLSRAPDGSDAGYVSSSVDQIKVDGLPLVKPPWGRITAIDLKSGDILWSRPNGDASKDVKNHPALAGIPIPFTGKPTRAGLLVTKTLLFAGEGWSGDPVLRALDKQTGETLAEIKLPGSQTGLPMTYVYQGHQYIAMTVGDGKGPAELIALSLPEATP